MSIYYILYSGGAAPVWAEQEDYEGGVGRAEGSQGQDLGAGKGKQQYIGNLLQQCIGNVVAGERESKNKQASCAGCWLRPFLIQLHQK